MASQTDDTALLRLLSRKPEAGIRSLQNAYGGLIFQIAIRILPGHPEDAEEVAADVLVTTWKQALSLLKNCKPLKPWLIVTARNRAIDKRRSLMRQTALPLDEDLDLLTEIQTSEGEDLIHELVLNLDEPDREIFLRRYYRMESAPEIGKALQMDARTVNVRLSRGRARLKQEYLKQMGKENPCHEGTQQSYRTAAHSS